MPPNHVSSRKCATPLSPIIDKAFTNQWSVSSTIYDLNNQGFLSWIPKSYGLAAMHSADTQLLKWVASIGSHVDVLVELPISFSGKAHGTSDFNSLRRSDAYMRHHIRLSLFHIMVCRLFGAKPLSEPILVYSRLHFGNIHVFQLNLNHNIKIFIEENEFVCKMASILSRPQCVNPFIDFCYE